MQFGIHIQFGGQHNNIWNLAVAAVPARDEKLLVPDTPPRQPRQYDIALAVESDRLTAFTLGRLMH